LDDVGGVSQPIPNVPLIVVHANKIPTQPPAPPLIIINITIMVIHDILFRNM
jgi:hypothetical protein